MTCKSPWPPKAGESVYHGFEGINVLTARPPTVHTDAVSVCTSGSTSASRESAGAREKVWCAPLGAWRIDIVRKAYFSFIAPFLKVRYTYILTVVGILAKLASFS